MDDETPRDKRKTDPMRFSQSDRVQVENRVNSLVAELRSRNDELAEARKTFYETRMVPLEDNVTKLRKVAYFSLGLATASLSVQLFRILVLALTGKLN